MPGKLNVQTLLQPIIDDISPELMARTDAAAAHEKASLLVPVMMEFSQLVRASEGILSGAQVTDAKHLVEGTANYVSWMLAKLNYEFNLQSSRTSEMQAWRYTLDAEILPRIALQDTNVWTVPEEFWPSCCLDKNEKRVYQVLGVKYLGEPHICVVSEVFRGSICRQKLPQGSIWAHQGSQVGRKNYKT